jgi:proteasome lid subunit RPN8/RPN11
VACLAPTALASPPALRQQLGLLLAAAAPQEGCALLLGTRQAGSGLWRLRRLWPCLNVWPRLDERRRRFAIDPREQLLAQRWGRQRGLEVLAHAHSHPQSPPEPSRTDRRLCLTPALLLIQGPSGEQRLWWLAADRAPALPVPWRMDG